MARFDNAVALALRLITKNGEVSTLRRKVDGALPDATKPWEPGTPTFTSFVSRCVWLDFKVDRIDGELVKVGDQQVFFPASTMAVDPDPATDHVVRADGERWTIVGPVQVLKPNGQRILVQCHVRK